MNASIRLERTYPARIERVFQALVDPDQLVRWWGPPDVETSAVDMDLRVGGACRWVLHPNGKRAVLHGRIVELDPPRLLVMTHRWEGDTAETLVSIMLEPVPAGTRLGLVHARLPDTVPRDEFALWWSATFESFAIHLRDDLRTQPGKDVPMPTAETAQLCRNYFAAWTNRRGPEALRPLLAEHFVFEAGPMRVEGRDQFSRRPPGRTEPAPK
jgi:uncharacterized protein YndB with AHSA1/START domain